MPEFHRLSVAVLCCYSTHTQVTVWQRLLASLSVEFFLNHYSILWYWYHIWMSIILFFWSLFQRDPAEVKITPFLGRIKCCCWKGTMAVIFTLLYFINYSLRILSRDRQLCTDRSVHGKTHQQPWYNTVQSMFLNTTSMVKNCSLLTMSVRICPGVNPLFSDITWFAAALQLILNSLIFVKVYSPTKHVRSIKLSTQTAIHDCNYLNSTWWCCLLVKSSIVLFIF